MPVNDPPPPSEPLNSKGSAALLLPKRHTSVNQQQIHPVNNAASSSSSFCSVTSLTSTKFLNLPISRKQQFSKLSLIADQFRSNPTSKSASKELLENAEEFSHLWPSGLFPCARTVSFHQYLCSCNDFSQQNSESSMNGNAYDVMAEESVYSNSIGHEALVVIADSVPLTRALEPAASRLLCVIYVAACAVLYVLQSAMRASTWSARSTAGSTSANGVARVTRYRARFSTRTSP